jgi:hypothetical protein
MFLPKSCSILCHAFLKNFTLTFKFLKEVLALMAFTDKQLKCKDCGKDFVFTAGEQEFYAEKQFTNEPQRCADCRKAKKAMRNNGGYNNRY